MKIVCIGYMHGSGGAEHQITMLANEMSHRGHEVHLFILAECNIKYDVLDSVVLHDLTSAETKGKNRIVNRYNALKNELLSVRPDVTVNFWLQSAYFCAVMSKTLYGKNVYAERGDPSDSEYNGLLGIVRNLSFMRIDGFVFQSKGAMNYFGESVKRRAVVIPNSVSVPQGKYPGPCKLREKKIVNVGRLHAQKNQKLLIESFSAIAEDFPDYILEIYGDGELNEDLQKQVKHLGLENRVLLKGTKKNVLDYVYNASLFVLSSDYEGMPNALMEAMAIGVPSISTDCRPGGAREIIIDGVNGIIVPAGNSEKLSRAISDMLSDKKTSCRMAENAYKTMLEFDKNKIYSKWENSFYSVIEKS